MHPPPFGLIWFALVLPDVFQKKKHKKGQNHKITKKIGLYIMLGLTVLTTCKSLNCTVLYAAGHAAHPRMFTSCCYDFFDLQVVKLERAC
jgi:hypothetical protein